MKPFHLHTQNLDDLANCIMSNGGVSNTIADVERVVVMHDDLYNQYYYIFHFCLIIGRDTLNLIVYYTIPHPHHIQYTHKRNISTHALPLHTLWNGPSLISCAEQVVLKIFNFPR